MITTIGPPPETRPLIQTAYSENSPAISPDGRWLAYQSNESGQSEVYVRPFPAVDGRFLFHVPASTTGKVVSRLQLVVVQNWFDELEARVPTTPH